LIFALVTIGGERAAEVVALGLLAGIPARRLVRSPIQDAFFSVLLEGERGDEPRQLVAEKVQTGHLSQLGERGGNAPCKLVSAEVQGGEALQLGERGGNPPCELVGTKLQVVEAC
jgi:hypothetical protein